MALSLLLRIKRSFDYSGSSQILRLCVTLVIKQANTVFYSNAVHDTQGTGTRISSEMESVREM